MLEYKRLERSYKAERTVRRFIQDHNAGIVNLLETRIKVQKMGNLYLSICPRWCFTSHSHYHKGGWVVVMWNPHMFDVNIS